MSCETNRELLELYALGILDAEERSEIDQHLRDNCSNCTAALREALALNSGVLSSVKLEQPPASLRERVVNSVRPPRRKAPLAWMGLAAALAFATVWLGWEANRRSNELTVASGRIRSLQVQSDELSNKLDFLRDPQTRPASAAPGANQPRGTYFVNPRSGVMLIASNLPAPAAGRAYEMWIIPKGQAPRPAGVFLPDANGSAVHLQTGPVDLTNTAAFAITDEPESGSPAPTTQPFLVTPAGT
ncbi:MAG TPA: anti-sigma factor [Bryobacteraceae bacterium]|nr:anti-sigma factor [Bryobacteraceae bacterium]